MKNEKKNAFVLIMGESDSGPNELFIEMTSKVVRIKNSHIKGSSLPSHRLPRQKGKCKKNRFRDIEEAIETLHRIERFRRYSAESGAIAGHRREIRAYKCPTCLGAHLTSQVEQGVSVVDYVAA